MSYSLEGKPNALLLVTDLEALHPFLRIGAIESQLQGQFHVPTVFLYPGVRTGKTRLKFLAFIPRMEIIVPSMSAVKKLRTSKGTKR